MTASDDPDASPRAPSGRVGLLAGLAVTAAAVITAIAFGLARADDPGTIVVEVVSLHERGAVGPPPSPIPDPGARTGFADFATDARWVPSGSRTDIAEGRTLSTIFWDRSGRRIAYTAVPGKPVDAPDDARRIGRRGVLLRSFDVAGRTAVTWNENGHTAVISAIGISRAALYNLAGGRATGR